MTFYKDIFILLHFYLYLYLQTCFVDGAVKSSLVFVIDDTGSMTDEINQVKQKTYEVFDAVLSSNGSAIDDFVLVTFNDPGTQLRIITRDKYAYKTEVEKIDVDGGGDCAELAMAGVQLALENSKPNSFLYVFTDASAKDYDKFEQVKSLSLKKSSQVTFLLTGLCDGTTTPDYLVFEKLSKATSGQVFNVEKDDINKVIDFIIESIKHKKTTLGKKEFGNSDATKSMTFTVDSKIWDVMISVSAATPRFHVLGPDNTEVTVETITNSASTYFGKLKTVPGTYTVVLNNVDHDARRSPPSVVVTGSTSVIFQHGFSTFKPSTINETSTKPIPEQPSFLSIELENNNRDVLLNTVALRDENDNVINEIPLVMVDEEQQFYTTEAFYPPPVTFKIAINGYTPTNERITRVSPTTVEYQKPDLIAETVKNLAPQVAILEGATVDAEYKNPLTVHCKVTAYPKPDVSWLNEKAEYIPSKVNAVDLPYEYMSIVNLEKVEENGTLTCIASNSLGVVMSSANIRVKTFFHVLEYPSDTTIEYGATKHLKLKIDSLPTATIVWYRGDDVINNSEYFDISDDNHTLTIKDMQPTLKGNYAVEAFNGLNAQRFDFEIFISGTDPPLVKIDGGDRLVKVGDLVQILCYVTGVPVPSVRWLVDGLEINATKKYKIYRDNTLSFRSAVQDMGVYTCEASNPLGKTHKDVRLDVFVPVNIQSPEQSILQLKVGDSVVLPCVADGLPRPNIEWMFFSKEPRTAPKSLRKDITNSVVIDRVQLNDEGLYTCVASNTNSLSNITYEVIVKAPPTIVNTLPDKTIEVVEGDLVLRIPCKVEGNPKPTVTWKFENGLNIVTGTEWYDVEEDGTLIIKNIDQYDAGIYICKAENSLGSNFENYRVTVVDFPTPDPSSVTNILLEEGKSFEVKCEISYKKSDLIRWFKDGRFIKDGDLILNNVDASDAGIYSCRVSNFLKSDSSHTNVIVGFKPLFTSDEETNIDFAAGAFIGLSCEARGEPKPKIQWKKNDQFILETSMFHVLLMDTNDIGQYTCEVRNEFGTISRTFNIIDAKGCTLNIDKNFETKQPLLLSTEEVNLVTIRSADGLLNIPAKHNISMFCPNSHINIQGIKFGDYISGACVNGSIINVDGVDVDFADIRCNDKIVPLTKSTGVSCGPGNTELLNIGYDTGFEFVVIYDVCIDKNNKLPIYTKHVMYPIAANTVTNEKIDFVGSKHIPFQFDDMYNCWMQRRGVLSLTGKRLSTDSRCCFAKRQLVSPRDVVPGYQQVATYNYLNVVPKWGTCGTENWDEVEERVRSLVKALDHPLEVYTGSSHLMKLPAQPKPNTVHLVDRFNRKQPVPRYIWKVIINHYNGDAVVVIQNNIPDITQHQAVSFMLCKDICHEVDWMRSRRPEEWRDVKKGFTFCCNVKEFETAFGFRDIFKIRELSSKVLLLL